MSIIIFIINENQIENINAQNDKKNNENIVIINKDKCKSYNIVKSKNKKNENKDMKNDKNIKEINNEKLIIKRI